MYLDLLIAINLVVNYFLLLLTAKLFRRNPGLVRLLAGAALGAPAALPAVVAVPRAIQVLLIPVVPLLMILVAFGRLRRLELLFTWGAFFMVSFMTGGAVMAAGLINGFPGSLEASRGIWLLFGSCLVLYLCLGGLRSYREEKRWQNCLSLDLVITWRGKNKAVKALLDTGNRLKDPFHHNPVIVIDYRSLEGLLPPAVYRILEDSELEPWIALPEKDDMARFFTLVPCRSLGNGCEVLLGFIPDAVQVAGGGRSWVINSRVVLGLNRRGFGPVADYQALMPPELMQAG